MADTFRMKSPGRALISNYLFIPAARKRRSNCRSNCLPLAILVMLRKTGLYRKRKINVNKNNFNSVLSEFSPEVNLSVPNTLAGNGEEENVRLRFTDIKDFEPEQVARQIRNSAPCWRCVIYYAISNPICSITPLSEKSLRQS